MLSSVKIYPTAIFLLLTSLLTQSCGDPPSTPAEEQTGGRPVGEGGLAKPDLCYAGTDPIYSQTEAYLAVPALNEEVQKWYNNGELSEKDKAKTEIYKSYFPAMKSAYNDYQDIIKLALEREKEFKDDYVFYHAFSSELRIIQDLIKAFYELENNTQVKDFEFVRSYKSDTYKDLPSLDQWLDETVQKYGSVSDHKLGPFLLSTNVTFFGNLLRRDSNTFRYFVKSFSAVPPPMGRIYDELLSKFLSSTQQRAHINSILQMAKELVDTQEGNILQIFIPLELVNDLAYLSIYRAGIWSEPVVPEVYSKESNRHQCISAVLDHLKNNPNEIGKTIDRFEARILPRREYFANPESGIKIFRYSTLDPDKEEKYLKLIRKIAEFIIVNRDK